MGILVATIDTESKGFVLADVGTELLVILVVPSPVGPFGDPLSVTDNVPLLFKTIPLTCTPFTILVPTPPKIEDPLKMLFAKLSMNILKFISDDVESEKGEVESC